MNPSATMRTRPPAVLAIMFMALIGCGKDAPRRPTAALDEDVPARVTDLHFLGFRDSSAVIAWTAPGDDGVTGTVERYDIRLATAPLTPSTWETAASVPALPMPRIAGAAETLRVSLRPLAADLWLALNAVDDAGNWSGLSNVVRLHPDELHWWDGFAGANMCCGSVVALILVNGELYAGGSFSLGSSTQDERATVARWNRQAWEAIGADLDGFEAVSFATLDGDLIAACSKVDLLGGTTGRVHRLQGGAWTPIGQEMDGFVDALTVYRDRLIVGGDFEAVGDSSAAHIAGWDGSSWSPLGSGLDGRVNALVVYQDRLIAGGAFSHAGGIRARGLAAWDGASWQPLGDGIEGVTIRSLAISGGTLYAGGEPERGMDDLTLIAGWDGIGWTRVPDLAGYEISAMVDFGGDLVVAGRPTDYWSSYDGLMRWDGARWRSFGDIARTVRALTVDGRRLYVGGDFEEAGPRTSPLVARWDE